MANTPFFAKHGLNVNSYFTVNSTHIVFTGANFSINSQTNLPDWAAIATSTKQAASANLSTYSTSANIAAWHALATSSKQDASSNLSTYSTSANIAAWHALATSSKQDASSNLSTYSTSANIAAWHALATSSKQDASSNLSTYSTSANIAAWHALSTSTKINVAGDAFTGVANTRAFNAPVSAAAAGNTTFIVLNGGGSSGDGNTALMSFLCTGLYGINMHLRPDGYFGIGGWSRGTWSWYSDPSGNMVAAGNVTAYSDPKLKERFERLNNAMDIISRLNGGTFYWKHGIPHIANKAGKRDYGILANEVEAVMPEIVSDSISLEGEVYKTVSYEKLVPVLIEAIKELKAEIDLLKKGKG